MKKIIVSTLFLFTALVCLSSAPLEARRHYRSTNVQVGFAQNYTPSSNVYVVRQYQQPAVIYAPNYYAPQYYAPQPQYYAPVYQVPQPPVCFEEVYVSRPFPVVSTGLNFSWNFFR